MKFRAGIWVLLAVWAVAQTPDKQPEPSPRRITGKVPIKKMVEPIYPAIAQQKGIQGRVVLDLTVNAEGTVKEMQVVSGDPILAKAFEDAAKKWRFEPQLRDGQAISFITRAAMTFGYEEPITEAKSAAPPQSSGVSAPSSGTAVGHLIKKVRPIYPEEARRNGVHGTVVIEGVIAKDGTLHDLKLISGPEELKKAAMGAVEQWQYTPYLLNGQPVEVKTTIKVNFNHGPQSEP